METSEFFGIEGVPRIPGSSLRGMLRALVEIITFGKIQPISNTRKYLALLGRASVQTPTTEA
ncbi:MAG: hypothetical protein IPK19_25045 [Chloroflexi bacterium]|nr:hypothetical protein [Chloroflexota bacterium]